MATEHEIYALLGRALADEDFRARLFDDPRQAAREAGFELTAEQVAGLKASDLQTIADSLDERLTKKRLVRPV